jgi:uncharacterized protein YqjF (DUF2071 family)
MFNFSQKNKSISGIIVIITNFIKCTYLHVTIMHKQKRVFLSAKWEYLAMLNYEVGAAVLQAHLPPYTEIDLWEGKAIVSVVGFMFNDTKVGGIKWPGFVSFEEVNLRYYVKHFDGKEWKRGVGFISEIVPQPLVAGLANLLYNEHYSAAEMNHSISTENNKLHATYNWRQKNQSWNTISVTADNTLQDIGAATEEEFIFEHYSGYNKLNNTTTIEYSVGHPRWQIYPVTAHKLICDIEKMYGAAFVPFIQGVQPRSVFLARGSDVNVRMPIKIKAAI